VTEPILLAAVRYATLVSGTLAASAILTRYLPVPWASSVGVLWSVGFLLGLRGLPIVGFVRGRKAKELSWSCAISAAFAPIFVVLLCVADPSKWVGCLFVLGCEAMAFYCIGKWTCLVAGCCRSVVPIQLLPLPLLEILVSLCVLASAALATMVSSLGVGLVVLASGHAATRAYSRWMRTASLRSIVAIDTIGIGGIVLLAFVRP
jgi:hypothetical protein